MLDTAQPQTEPARTGGGRLHEWTKRTRPILRYDLPAAGPRAAGRRFEQHPQR
jgi:hypothetical protein